MDLGVLLEAPQVSQSSSRVGACTGETTYIKISSDYKKCKFEYDGWLHNDIKR